ncbi:hypothetical protein K4F52_009801 [Lecanicillium sp. MT-2017a]|nr:hypothetical protein K4F52_009801 [Lecanicillium sp. MT-2017a]
MRPKRETKLLTLSLPRMGTASLAEAFAVLGYQGVYHNLYVMDETDNWAIVSRAADASFPSLPTFTGKPFTRSEWDELYASYEAITDMAAFFGKQLTEAYPNAKVVLVQRDYDKWFKSMDEGIFQWFDYWLVKGYIQLIEPLLGLHAGGAGLKSILGYFEARNIGEARENAPRIYAQHYRNIPTLVPPARLLYFKLEDGWGPLCEFLGKPIPDVAFPHINEAAALNAKFREKLRRDISSAALVTLRWFCGAVVVAGVSWIIAKRSALLNL